MRCTGKIFLSVICCNKQLVYGIKLSLLEDLMKCIPTRGKNNLVYSIFWHILKLSVSIFQSQCKYILFDINVMHL